MYRPRRWRWSYPVARVYEFLALIVGFGIAAFLHPQYPHLAIKLYESLPFIFELGLIEAVMAAIFIPISIMYPKFEELPLIVRNLILLFGAVALLAGFPAYIEPRYLALLPHSAISTTSLTLVSTTTIVDPPVFDAAPLIRGNFFGENDAGWALRSGNEKLTVVPTFQFRFHTEGFLVSLRPVWTGDFLLQANGQSENLNPDQALHDPRLRDAPLYPPTVLEQLWTRYEHMHFGVWFPNDPPSQFDPFLLKTSDAFYWAVPVGNHFEGNQSRFTQFLTLNARTGEVSLARLQLSSKDFPGGKMPLFSDGQWQPSRFLVEDPSTGEFQIVSSESP